MMGGGQRQVVEMGRHERRPPAAGRAVRGTGSPPPCFPWRARHTALLPSIFSVQVRGSSRAPQGPSVDPWCDQGGVSGQKPQ